MKKINKIINIVIAGILIINTADYGYALPSQSSLRVPIQQDTYNRVGDAQKKANIKKEVSVQDLFNTLEWDEPMDKVVAQSIDLMQLSLGCTVVNIGPFIYPREPVGLASRGVRVLVVQPDKDSLVDMNQIEILKTDIERLREKIKKITGMDITNNIAYIESSIENAKIEPNSAKAIVMLNVYPLGYVNYGQALSAQFDAVIKGLSKDGGYLLYGGFFVPYTSQSPCGQFEGYCKDRDIPIKIIKRFDEIRNQGEAVYKLYQLQSKIEEPAESTTTEIAVSQKPHEQLGNIYKRELSSLLRRKDGKGRVRLDTDFSIERLFGATSEGLKGKDVLVLGCGGGTYCFSAILKGVNRAVGVDFDENSIKVAKIIAPFIHDPRLKLGLMRHVPKLDAEVFETPEQSLERVEPPNNLQFIESDARDLSFLESNSFDAVAIPHLIGIENGMLGALQEAMRVLKPNGTLFIFPYLTMEEVVSSNEYEELPAMLYLTSIVQFLQQEGYKGKRLVATNNDQTLFEIQMIQEDKNLSKPTGLKDRLKKTLQRLKSCI